jgi:hypothetical protein
LRTFAFKASPMLVKHRIFHLNDGDCAQLDVDGVELVTVEKDVANDVTSNGPGKISLSVNNLDATGPLALIDTHNSQDPIDWRQWHHWNKMTGLARLHLSAGKQLLTLHVVANGNMNFDYLEFVPAR